MQQTTKTAIHGIDGFTEQRILNGMSLDARLLAACHVSYDAMFTGPYLEETDFTRAAGFLEPPHIFVGGDLDIHAALVGKTADGLVVVFRGTLAFDDQTKTQAQRVLDWASDFHCELTERLDMPGLVHAGFSEAFDTLAQQVDEFVDGRKCIFTGHSKGAALATIAAYRYSKRFSRPTIVTTFGGPRVGDAAFAEAYAQSPVSLVRWECAGDLVPRVPLDLRAAQILANSLGVEFPHADYSPVGQLVFIESDAGIKRPKNVFAAAAAECESLFDIGAKYISGGGAKAIRQAHSIEKDSLYWKALNPVSQGDPS